MICTKLRTATFYFLCCLIAAAQSPVDMAEEPHHGLLLENSHVRVFELRLPPREATLPIRQEHNFFFIVFDESEIVSWREGTAGVIGTRFRAGDARFDFAGPPRHLRNDSSVPFSAIFIEFLDSKVTTYGYHQGKWQFGPDALPPPANA